MEHRSLNHLYLFQTLLWSHNSIIFWEIVNTREFWWRILWKGLIIFQRVKTFSLVNTWMFNLNTFCTVTYFKGEVCPPPYPLLTVLIWGTTAELENHPKNKCTLYKELNKATVMHGREQTIASDSHCRLDSQTQKLLQQPKHLELSQCKSLRVHARHSCPLSHTQTQTHTHARTHTLTRTSSSYLQDARMPMRGDAGEIDSRDPSV